MNVIEIFARRSIGPIALGPLPPSLRSQAKFTGPVGELQGIKFSVVADQVEDVWIEDLRTFPGEVRFEGERLAADIGLEQLKAKLGDCVRVDVKGGVFFNCSVGLTVGTDFDARGDFIQLRLKPR